MGWHWRGLASKPAGGLYRLGLSTHPDPLDERTYELEKSRVDKKRKFTLYKELTGPGEYEKKPRGEQEAFWQDIVKIVVKRLEELKQEMGDSELRPAVRTIWYDLVAAGVITNNVQNYNGLGYRLTEARHKWLIEPDAFLDETRPEVIDMPDDTPESYAHWKTLHLIRYAPEHYDAPRWHGQKYHVEVWCEKLAQYSMLKHILEDKQVTIQIHRGHPSYTMLYEAYRRLSRLQLYEKEKKIVLLYLGDWDPDGDLMDETICDYLDRFGERYGEIDYYFERVAVLAEHETAFGVTLPSDPDKRTFERDARGRPKNKNAARFEDRYGEIKQIELDALTSKELLPHFKKLLRNKVDEYWDEDVWHEKVEGKMTEEVVKEEIWKLINLTDEGQETFKRSLVLSEKEVKKEEYKWLRQRRQEIRYMPDDESKLKSLQEDKENFKNRIKDLKSGVDEVGRRGYLSARYYRRRIKDIDIELKRLNDKGIVLLKKKENGDEENEKEEEKE